MRVSRTVRGHEAPGKAALVNVEPDNGRPGRVAEHGGLHKTSFCGWVPCIQRGRGFEEAGALRGRPRSRSAMMLRNTSVVPP